MKFEEILLKGAWVIDLDAVVDGRGYFARAYCEHEFKAHGIDPKVVQCNLAFNHKAGTLRGMHFQTAPAEESKLVRCVRGGVYDVIIDLRPESPTYLMHYGVELSAENKRMLYAPKGFAHGYQTLVDETEVFYMVSESYTPEYERGYRYNDPRFDIQWPLPIRALSEKDAGWPLFESTH
jgi:dTDP-4-dehydrorhamnose 3,5-epimerase